MFTKVRNALAKAKFMCWDGCHKIYLVMDDETAERQQNYGYELVAPSYDELLDWWDNSCSLRFISAVSSGERFEDVIGQFECEDEE